MTIEIFNDDCWEHIKTMSDNSIDAIVTDPPYDIGFMNKGWDKNSIVTKTEFWKECLRVLKPGGYILAFSHSRTAHRQTSAIEDAGFEIRDTVMWLYGQGFPKSHNVGLSIDKKYGGKNRGRAIPTASSYQASDKEQKNKLIANKVDAYVAKTEEGKKWQGWGTALKPAYEPVVMARKPLEGTVADNVEKWSTGAINIDACRIAARFPANVVMDEEAGKILDEQTGIKKASFVRNTTDGARPFGNDGKETNYISEKIEVEEDDKGASRFFYCPKVGKKERGKDNVHPTVKPVKLMEYLIKLVSREGATVLDPFMGSGSTGIACKNLNRNFVGIEKEKEYFQISQARLDTKEEQ
jgi:DNA modification methylase